MQPKVILTTYQTLTENRFSITFSHVTEIFRLDIKARLAKPDIKSTTLFKLKLMSLIATDA